MKDFFSEIFTNEVWEDLVRNHRDLFDNALPNNRSINPAEIIDAQIPGLVRTEVGRNAFQSQERKMIRKIILQLKIS